MSTEIDLAAIKARVEAATPGPWERGNHYHVQGSAYCQCLPENGPLVGVDPHGSYGEMHIHRLPRAWMSEGIRSRDDATGGVDVVIETDEYGTMADADAEFIASAREDVPALVAEVERLRGLLEITDAMVERARVAYVAAHYGQVRRGVDADFSKPMRAALEAALGVNH